VDPDPDPCIVKELDLDPETLSETLFAGPPSREGPSPWRSSSRPSMGISSRSSFSSGKTPFFRHPSRNNFAVGSLFSDYVYFGKHGCGFFFLYIVT